jgi:hypothetical protein
MIIAAEHNMYPASADLEVSTRSPEGFPPATLGPGGESSGLLRVRSVKNLPIDPGLLVVMLQLQIRKRMHRLVLAACCCYDGVFCLQLLLAATAVCCILLPLCTAASLRGPSKKAYRRLAWHPADSKAPTGD